jgi:ferredoxin
VRSLSVRRITVEHIIIGPECIGTGLCEFTDPDVFEVTDEGRSSVLVEGVPKDHRDKIEEAIRACPTHAIRLIQDPSSRSIAEVTEGSGRDER